MIWLARLFVTLTADCILRLVLSVVSAGHAADELAELWESFTEP